MNTTYKKSNLKKICNKFTKKNKKNKKLVYPSIKPFKKDFLQVSDIHKIAYYLYGNPNGIPVLVLHGGPGAGSLHYEAQFFNPKKFFIVLFDQRGSGKSSPSGSLQDNDTKHLVQDCETIRNFLNVKKFIIYGGSWGSTLALSYAIKYPLNVSHLILSAIYLGSTNERDWVQEGKGANLIFPQQWLQYKNFIPPKERKSYINAYGKRINGKMGPKIQQKASLEWLVWEDSLASFRTRTRDKIIKSFKDMDYVSYAKIHHHFVKNNCFFPYNDYLVNKKNTNKIKHIPTLILHGQYDILCPYENAFKLHKALPNSEFHTTPSGHSYSDEQIKIIVNHTKKIYKNFKK
jgi:proline iminopeptidase